MRIFSITLLLISFSFLICSKNYATSWYVDNAANGANNGTSWANAWQSFADITWEGGGVTAGDTLYISGGSTSKTYSEVLSIGASGSADNPIVIKVGQTAGHNGVVIINRELSANSKGIDGDDYHYITIDGNDGNDNRHIMVTQTAHQAVKFNDALSIILKYINIQNVGNDDNWGNGFSISDARDGTEIAYCVIDSVYRHGILAGSQHYYSGYGTGASIHHNIISNIGEDVITADEGNDIYNNIIGPPYQSGAGYSDGMQIYGGYNRVFNNTIYASHFKSDGSHALIYFELFSTHQTDNIQIYNNIIYVENGAYENNQYLGIKVKLNTAVSVDSVLVANNTFVDVPHTAITFTTNDASRSFTNCIVKNNLIYNVGKQSRYVSVIALNDADYSTSDVLVSANVVHEGTVGTQRMQFDGTAYTSVSAFDAATGFSNRHILPSFVSYQVGNGSQSNFHLEGSDTSSIDRGEDLSAFFTADKDGNIRSGTWDIGAYEFINGVGGTQPSIPTGLRVIK